jgi:peptide/nickel transport system permease protein
VTAAVAVRSLPRASVRAFRSLPTSGRAGVLIIAVIVILGLVVPILSPYDMYLQVGKANAAPSLAHPFGLDSLGRDNITRSFGAVRIDIVVAVVGVMIPLLMGTVVGGLAGTTDLRIVRTIVGLLVDGINAFPFLILALGVIAVIGTGAQAMIIAIAFTSWARYAKLARTRAAVLRDLDFVSALRLLGYSRVRITVRHILPNCFSETFAYGVSDFTLVILTVAALSFLGAGVRPPEPEWGSMMADGRIYLQSAPWILVGPGIVLTITAFGVSLIGEAHKERSRG